MIGLLGRYVLTSSGQDVETVLGVSGENVLALLLETVMPAAIIGFYIAAVLSAVMSTVDSLLVVASSAITIDFYQQLFKQKTNEQQLIIFSKKMVGLLC